MSKRILISGGGTGGHIFPAISIANALRERLPDADILFVGAQGKMEMEKVPEAGYRIVGLPVAGFQRRLTLRNFAVLFKLIGSLMRARRVVSEFDPHLAVGVGGYASGPVVRVAAGRGVPVLLQEQNSYAGVTNKLLARKASVICVAYEQMERFFPEHKLVLTGNPIRKDLLRTPDRAEALAHFGLDANKRTLLIVGGSLGARSVNNAVANKLRLLCEAGIQVIWQTGKLYYDEMLARTQAEGCTDVHVMPFIGRMDYAYRVAHLVVSRAGAGTISELCAVGKAAILVPSPNVAEDHQTKNAMALVDKGAAVLVQDANADDQLVRRALEVIQDPDRCHLLADKIRSMALPDAADRIADEALKLLDTKHA